MDKQEGAGGPLSPEIVKLTEKLAKDPKSRLFVPLAEEYLKGGMLDEAAIVLTDGLGIHPTFHAARVMLGRVFLEKGKVAEAKAEFEQVIQTSPDNLLAQRKLAKIYKDEGQIAKTRNACEAVLILNPKDAEMKAIMQALEQTVPAQPERRSRPIVVEPPPASVKAAESEVTVVQFSEEAPAASSPTGEIFSEALADLYVQQGYYEKGIAMYRQLLANDLSNQGLFRKLDEAIEQVRRLNEESPIMKGARAERPPPVDYERQRMQKIQRLQDWLDNVKKRQGR